MKENVSPDEKKKKYFLEVKCYFHITKQSWIRPKAGLLLRAVTFWEDQRVKFLQSENIPRK